MKKQRLLAAGLALMGALYIPTLSQATSLLGDGFQLEIQAEPTATPKPETLTFTLGAQMPRPGEKPRISSLNVQTQASLRFETPMAPAQADLRNAEDSGLIVVYVLRMSVAEMQRKTGRTGYTGEQYMALSEREGFDPETSYITLSQSKGIPPGMSVDEITLGTLPDGSTLPAGDYTGELVMVPFSADTMEEAMINVNVEMQFSVENDMIILHLDEDGRAPLQAFNPIDAQQDIYLEIQVSQSEVREVTGQPHNTAEVLAAQEADPAFNSLYEQYTFMSLFRSDPIAPGGFLEEVVLTTLPDGTPLPPGTYDAWLVRYGDGEAELLDASTQIQLIVP